MEPDVTPITADRRPIVCPNCGAEQAFTGLDSRCDRCGTLLDPAGSGKQGIVGAPIPGEADPAQVPPPAAAGGIGGTNDGTQVTHHPTSAVPGKPMAPIADEPAGRSTLEGQAMDPPAGQTTHAERGGSG